MDSVLVETEDKIVEKVLRRIEENNLYIKPEKYIWKAKKINFLGLVIGADRIKIQKKVAGVYEWPKPK